MKDKEGFTLIELLAVIVLLAIILVIATTQVGKAIKHNKAKSFNNSAVAIVESAKRYLKSNNNKPNTDFLMTTLNTLNKYDKDTMELSIKDAKNGDKTVGYMIALTYKKDDITPSDFEDEIKIKGFGYPNNNNNKIEICAYVDYEGKFWAAAADDKCDSEKSPIVPSNNTILPGIVGGDTPITTSIANTSSPNIEVNTTNKPPEEKFKPVALRREFNCCPTNNQTIFSPDYVVNRGSEYTCSKDGGKLANGYCEGRNRFHTSHDKEKLNTTMLCSPTKDNIYKAFAISEIVKGAGYSDTVKTFDECVNKEICKGIGNITTGFGSEIGTYGNIYAIKKNLKYGVEDDPLYSGEAPKPGQREIKDVGLTYDMADSHLLIILDKSKIFKLDNGEDGFKSVFFAFYISDSEWDRKIWNGMKRFLSHKKIYVNRNTRHNVEVFRYKNIIINQNIESTNHTTGELGCSGFN